MHSRALVALSVVLVAMGMFACSKSDPKAEALCEDLRGVQELLDGVRGLDLDPVEALGAVDALDAVAPLEQNLADDSAAYFLAGEVQTSRLIDSVAEELSSAAVTTLTGLGSEEAFSESMRQLRERVSC